MSARVTLTLRSPLTEDLDMTRFAVDQCARLTEPEIARQPVWAGSRQHALGDMFIVEGGGSDAVIVRGDVSRVDGLAAGMAGGSLLVEGSAGTRLAEGLSGGCVVVDGDVGDDAGAGMRAGSLHVRGRAGDRLGAAAPGAATGMTGGEIVVAGAAGRDAAARIRRGLVVIGGDAGPDAGRAMIAGTLVVLGRAGLAGRGSRRGTVIAAGGVTVPETYRAAACCTFSFVRLVLVRLRRRYGVVVSDAAMDGLYRRHCGDAGVPGKGEILELVAGPASGDASDACR
jgi:formylmethanofuran dehydrogenase subunit C